MNMAMMAAPIQVVIGNKNRIAPVHSISQDPMRNIGCET
jgi:hypothetical protein